MDAAVEAPVAVQAWLAVAASTWLPPLTRLEVRRVRRSVAWILVTAAAVVVVVVVVGLAVATTLQVLVAELVLAMLPVAGVRRAVTVSRWPACHTTRMRMTKPWLVSVVTR